VELCTDFSNIPQCGLQGFELGRLVSHLKTLVSRKNSVQENLNFIPPFLNEYASLALSTAFAATTGCCVPPSSSLAAKSRFCHSGTGSSGSLLTLMQRHFGVESYLAHRLSSYGNFQCLNEKEH
jgi:hypothetical protein